MSKNPVDSAIYRSWLFIPANQARFIDKAHTRGADCIILDLEDSVANADKPSARAQLSQHYARLSAAQQPFALRINADLLSEDLVLHPQLCALILPKVECAEQIQNLSGQLTQAEVAQNIAPQTMRIIALIENARGYLNLASIAGADSRLLGLAFGSEDFMLDTGMSAEIEVLHGVCQHISLVARAHHLQAIGFPGSLANFANPDLLAQQLQRGKALGMTGALAIHPSQVALMNAAFSPSANDIAWANAVMQRMDEVNHQAVAKVNGQMIDRPVYLRAQQILAHSTQLSHQPISSESKSVAMPEISEKYREKNPHLQNLLSCLGVDNLTGQKILDIGCGTGEFAQRLYQYGAQVFGIEPQTELVARCGQQDWAKSAVKSAVQSSKLPQPTAAGLAVCGVAEALPFAPETFTLSVFFNSLHHVPMATMSAALHEAWRVTRTGGKLYIIEPRIDCSYFQLVKQIDDETTVRQAAQQAIADFLHQYQGNHQGNPQDGDQGKYQIKPLNVSKLNYRFPVVFADFAAFENRMTQVDATRATAIAAQRTSLDALFHQLGETHADGLAQGWTFDSATQVICIEKPAS